MNKKILLFFVIIIYSFTSKAQQQCSNLNVESTVATCAIPSTTLNAIFLNTEYRTTDTYVVNGETPCPPEIIDEPTNIVVDDQWSPIIFNIGFTFCFYGNMYDQIIVSGNGVVSFDLNIVEDYLVTNPNGTGPFHTWNTDASLDLPSPQLQPNAIFCYTDPHMGLSGANASAELLNQLEVGNRVFALELEAPMYSCTDEFYHVVFRLYETSNVIDVEILEKGRCDGWENSTGIVGIQNKSATLATTVPGRTNADGGWWVNGDPNYGGVEADQELWRFVPDGNLLNYSFKWFADYGNGYEELFPNQNVDPNIIDVNPEYETDYQAVLTYQTECIYGNDIVLTEEVTVIPVNLPNVSEPEDMLLCESVVGGGTATFNLDQQAIILAQYDAADWSDLLITYHETYADAENNTNAIVDINNYEASDGTIIYVRVEDANDSDCEDFFKSFVLSVSSMDAPDFSYDQSAYCTSDLIATATATTAGGEYTITNGGVINALTGEIDLVASGLGDDGLGIYTITYTINNGDCPSSSNVDISIVITEDATFEYSLDPLLPLMVCVSDANPSPISITTPGGEFLINNGGTIDASDGTIDLAATVVGTYVVTYSFNPNGSCPSSETRTVIISNNDDATFSYQNSLYCNNDVNPVPTANIAGGVYTINNGGVIDVNTGEIDLMMSGLGNDDTGNFTITYTTNGNCSNSSDENITIEERKDATFSFPTDVCIYDTNPEAYDIVDVDGSFSVNNGASIDSNGILDLSTTTQGTQYEIKYSFGGNCESEYTQFITVHETPMANNPYTYLEECNNGDGSANFDLSVLDDEILVGQSGVTLTYHHTEDDANDNSNEITSNPARIYGDIWARVENANGCYSTVLVPLIIEDCYIVLPEGFSPNSNVEDNKIFNVNGLREIYPKFSLFIYNRYGRLVYEGDETTDDWNGKLENEGDILPTGTYFYGLKLNDERGIEYRGWVYLQQ